MQEDLSPATQIRAMDKGIVQMRLWLEKFTDTPASWFGLDYSDVFVERIPLVLGRQKSVSKYHLKRRE